MLLRIAWGFLGLELLIAIVCGLTLWYFWSHSAMDRAVVVKAMTVYVLGSIACIALTLLIPL